MSTNTTTIYPLVQVVTDEDHPYHVTYSVMVATGPRGQCEPVIILSDKPERAEEIAECLRRFASEVERRHPAARIEQLEAALAEEKLAHAFARGQLSEYRRALAESSQAAPTVDAKTGMRVGPDFGGCRATK